MNAVVDKFEKIGAKVIFREPRTVRWGEPEFRIDIDRQDRFELSIPSDTRVETLDVRPDLRHLVLFVQNERGKTHFLCGHDERHWFVAPVSRSVSTVMAAMQALKPRAVVQAETGLKSSKKMKRHNSARKRQGEWFFVPAPDAQIDEKLILKNEPLQRGRNKPHLAELLYRRGGETGFARTTPVDNQPEFLSPAEFEQFIRTHPQEARLWRGRRRNATVYVKGRITHSDHKTLVLKEWHRVYANTESGNVSGMAFLD